MTIAELEPLTIRSGGSSSNHYATLPPKKKSAQLWSCCFLERECLFIYYILCVVDSVAVRVE